LFRIDRNLVQHAGIRALTPHTIKGSGSYKDKEAKEPETETETETEAEDTGPSIEEMLASAALNAEETIEKARAILVKSEEEASRILSHARDEAAALLVATREQAEEDRKEARQEGYAEGSETGRQEGRREFDEKYAQKAKEDDEALKRVIAEIYKQWEHVYDGFDDNLASLALEIVRKIFNPSGENGEELFEPMIRNALKQMNLHGKTVIRVGTADFERFFPSGGATFDLDNGVTVKATVIKDPSLAEGGAIIDTDTETVNAGFDTQLKLIQIAFDGAS
jgi:flagellar assembly protein FliH